ncbi:DnaD domain-containing protein [Kallotenue papyrolyticum]|uniref:DnaD domain-containing protein n=1 Tax=Kallotenue papyrolyticum TaxID=1325125 RepID=UPI0004926F0D|nr:DnaD domain protein [Kallotenue papyrolyticum]
MTFTGFSTDDPIKLPRELFTEIVPAITQPAELKVTLHFFYLLRQSRRRPRMVEWSELRDDTMLTRSLRAIAPLRPTDEVLIDGLAAAVRRGTLLHAAIPEGPRVGNWYLANTERNRVWIARMVEGDISWTPGPAAPVARPGIFALYEQNIGVLTPLLAEELKEAQERYPAGWIEDAIREAVRANKRAWRYVRAVLERWARDGRGDQPTSASDDPERYISGQLSNLIRY